jgi:hypothetical protein
MGGHSFLHLPAVGPASQYQGKLSLASLIRSWNFCISSLSLDHISGVTLLLASHVF